MNIFISYNRLNSVFVSSIIQRLRGDFSIIKELFFDKDSLEPGQVWTDEIQQALVNSDACIIFIGEQGIGGWQNKEVLSAVNKFVDSKGTFKLIPVITPHNKSEPVQKNFPWFLADMQWIEFLNETDADAFQKLIAALSEGEEPPPADLNIVPYKGLDFFDVQDAPLFFGRTFDLNWIFYKKLTLELLNTNRFLAIVGDSGSGKSSFARAGILAALKAGRFMGSENWKQLVFSPEDNPLLKLAATLQSAGIIQDAGKMEKDAAADPASLRRTLEVHGKRVVLLIDQFEEVLTQCKDNLARESFLKNITEALKSQHLVCIVTMRSDFYATFSSFREFADMLEANNYTITSLDFNTGGEEWERYLKDIIQKPAKLLGVQFDSILTSQILEDSKRINGILPALQLALVELWKKRKEVKKIQSSDYDNLAHGKGIAGIIEEHANSIWKALTKDENDKQSANLIKAIFIRLVEITGNKEDVRKTVNKAELINDLSSQYTQTEIEKILNILSGINVRLIRIKQDKSTTSGAWIEVIHEALIRQWELLRKWLNERRDAITYKNKLEQYIDDDNKLYSGKKLAAAELWVNNNKDLTTNKINGFIKSCREQVNKRKYSAAISAIVMLLLIVSAWLYKPVYQCNNCQLVQNWANGNYDVDDVHMLVLNGTSDIKFIRCFKHLDNLVLAGKTAENYLSQEHIDQLPKGLKQLTIKGFGLSDSVLKFNSFTNLKVLKIISFNGLKRIDIRNSDRLTELHLEDMDSYKDLSGIDGLVNLQYLSLAGLSQVTDFSGLSTMINLQTLYLSQLQLNSFVEFRHLQKLTNLSLDRLNILSLEELNTMTGLQSLSLSSLPKIAGLSGIGSLRALQTFYLNLHLDSINEIEKLTHLRSLTLFDAHIADLSSITNLVNLESLSLQQLSIPDLNGIQNLQKLQSLSLIKLSIGGITEIKNLQNLKELYLSELGFANLTGIENTGLTKLTVSHLTNLRSIPEARTLNNLFELELDDLPLEDLSGIEQIRKLQVLTLSGLKIMNLNDVGKCETVRKLTLSGLPLADIKGISNIKTLETVIINGMESNLDDIANIDHLKSLRLISLYTKSISFIEHLKNVNQLSLENLIASENIPFPILKGNAVNDSLLLIGVKLSNLHFIDNTLKVKYVGYDDDVALPNKQSEFKNTARQMSEVKFLNLSMTRENLE